LKKYLKTGLKLWLRSPDLQSSSWPAHFVALLCWTSSKTCA